jgi:diaminopimelate decarboxylase
LRDVPTPMRFREALDRELADAGLELPPVPAIEPGRFLVGAAGSLVASVLHTRTRGQGRQIVLDTGMTELIRPALYGRAHHVTALAGGVQAEREPVLVEGAVCESTDSFGVHELPVLSRGDLVVLHEAVAYAASFSSRYNGRPQALEVLLRPDGTLELAERTSPPARDWAGEPTEGQGVDGRPRSERKHP